MVAFISLVQLLISCFAEYKKMKNPSFVKACRITTQKLLYFVVFLASLLRAAYFTQPESAQPSWCYYLMSAFYPLVMTCASLIVCYWAEVSFLSLDYENVSNTEKLINFFFSYMTPTPKPYRRPFISEIFVMSDNSCRKADWVSMHLIFFHTVFSELR